MSRLRPYTTNQVTWNSIFQNAYDIPMNNRNYDWEEPEIDEFFNDLISIYEKGKYVEKLGSIINLKYDGHNYIYDGQQRILTTIIILLCISNLSETLKPKIQNHLTVDTYLHELTIEQKKLNDNGLIIPKISCVNPYDMKALTNIFNNNVNSFIDYVSNKNDIISLDENETYVCLKCDKKIKTKRSFINHIVTKHQYTKPPVDSKLYTAYIQIYNHFKIINYNETKLKDLYKFILSDIDIQFYDVTDPEYASIMFDWDNNRGKDVPKIDITKNNILVKIPDDKKMETYDKWETLTHTDNKIYKKEYGQKIFDIAIQIYNGKINRTIEQNKLFKPIIDSDDTYRELNIFFKIVEKLFQIMNVISSHKYGKLINNSTRICVNWEAYMWCMLPIFYTTNSINNELIILITKWYFRNIGFKTRTFNNLCYSNKLIEITNMVINDNNYDYYKSIEENLKEHKDNLIKEAVYEKNLSELTFRSTNATHLLFFLETCINTDIHIVPLTFTLEHIHCQKEKNKLTNPALNDNIGNLTLIEGKNSENGHKGNSSLGDKPYTQKVDSYKESACKLTRNIADEFTDFNEETINVRCSKIAKLLNEYTNY
tara:strand:+ start:8990 stop:10783 length:1794 start_codon:yes stop_codon:yes gene_type:complete